jgi:hypothetical protein
MNINRLAPRFGLICFLLTAGTLLSCGGANGDEAQVSDTRADGTKMSAEDKEAAAFLQARLAEHWLKGPDGWTTQGAVRNVFGQVKPGETPVILFKQYRVLSFTIAPGTLTEAMKLNGSDYRGEAVFKDSPGRYFRTEADFEGPNGWGPWKDNLLMLHRIAIERRNGQWILSDDYLFDEEKPTLPVPSGT